MRRLARPIAKDSSRESSAIDDGTVSGMKRG
jgi:hypothetical protein